SSPNYTNFTVILISDLVSFFFFFTATSTSKFYTLSLHDALPISRPVPPCCRVVEASACSNARKRRPICSLVSPIPVSETEKQTRSEEHTSELQSRFDLVCRLLLEKKKK